MRFLQVLLASVAVLLVSISLVEEQRIERPLKIQVADSQTANPLVNLERAPASVASYAPRDEEMEPLEGAGWVEVQRSSGDSPDLKLISLADSVVERGGTALLHRLNSGVLGEVHLGQLSKMALLHRDPEVRESALLAFLRVQTVKSSEALLSVLKSQGRQGSPEAKKTLRVLSGLPLTQNTQSYLRRIRSEHPSREMRELADTTIEAWERVAGRGRPEHPILDRTVAHRHEE